MLVEGSLPAGPSERIEVQVSPVSPGLSWMASVHGPKETQRLNRTLLEDGTCFITSFSRFGRADDEGYVR